MSNKLKATDKYKKFNHHHEITEDHELVNIGGEEFIANKKAIPLLRALNDVGLKTRSHHIGDENNFICILLDNATVEVKEVFEKDATRTKYNGKKEILIQWNA